MAFTFKRQIFGFMDLLRFKKMVPKRREKLAEGSSAPLPKTYRVNETAKILHPGIRARNLPRIEQNTADTKTYTFETERPFYFRAGQYVTLGCKVGRAKSPARTRSPPRRRRRSQARLADRQKVRVFQRVPLRRGKGRRCFHPRRPFGRFLP